MADNLSDKEYRQLLKEIMLSTQSKGEFEWAVSEIRKLNKKDVESFEASQYPSLKLTENQQSKLRWFMFAYEAHSINDSIYIDEELDDISPKLWTQATTVGLPFTIEKNSRRGDDSAKKMQKRTLSQLVKKGVFEVNESFENKEVPFTINVKLTPKAKKAVMDDIDDLRSLVAESFEASTGDIEMDRTLLQEQMQRFKDDPEMLEAIKNMVQTYGVGGALNNIEMLDRWLEEWEREEKEESERNYKNILRNNKGLTKKLKKDPRYRSPFKAETFNAENSDMGKKALVESEVNVKMNELFEFVQNNVGAEDGAGGDLYDPNGLDEIETAVSDYFVGYWDFESRHNSNNSSHLNAETFEAEIYDRQGNLRTVDDNFIEATNDKLQALHRLLEANRKQILATNSQDTKTRLREERYRIQDAMARLRAFIDDPINHDGGEFMVRLGAETFEADCRDCYGTGGLYDSRLGIDDGCASCGGTGEHSIKGYKELLKLEAEALVIPDGDSVPHHILYRLDREGIKYSFIEGDFEAENFEAKGDDKYYINDRPQWMPKLMKDSVENEGEGTYNRHDKSYVAGLFLKSVKDARLNGILKQTNYQDSDVVGFIMPFDLITRKLAKDYEPLVLKDNFGKSKKYLLINGTPYNYDIFNSMLMRLHPKTEVRISGKPKYPLMFEFKFLNENYLMFLAPYVGDDFDVSQHGDYAKEVMSKSGAGFGFKSPLPENWEGQKKMSNELKDEKLREDIEKVEGNDPDFDPEKADRDNDGEISDWERAVGNAVAKGIRENKERKEAESRPVSYMVKSDAHKLNQASKRIHDKADGKREYPEWWKSKLSVVRNDADKLSDFLDYAVVEGVFESEGDHDHEEIDELIDKLNTVVDFAITFVHDGGYGGEPKGILVDEDLGLKTEVVHYIEGSIQLNLVRDIDTNELLSVRFSLTGDPDQTPIVYLPLPEEITTVPEDDRISAKN